MHQHHTEQINDLTARITRWGQRLALTVVALAVFVLAMIALFATGSAYAQPPAAYVDAKVGTGAECVPGYYGQAWPGSVHREAFRGDAGWHAFAFCIGAGGKPVYVYKTCAHGECATMASIYQGIGNLLTTAVGKDRATVALDYLKINPSLYHCGIRAPGVAAPAVPLAGLPPAGSARARACAELTAAMHKDWPLTLGQVLPEPSYAVKLNGTVPTRPAYTLTNGVRGTKEVARATVGQRCSLDSPTIASGNDLWAEFGPEFLHGRVALCAKR